MDDAAAIVAVANIVRRPRRRHPELDMTQHRRVVAAALLGVLRQQRGNGAAQLHEQQDGEEEPGDGLKMPLHAR